MYVLTAETQGQNVANINKTVKSKIAHVWLVCIYQVNLVPWLSGLKSRYFFRGVVNIPNNGTKCCLEALWPVQLPQS